MTFTQKIINYLAGYDISKKIEQLYQAIREKDDTIHQLEETSKNIKNKNQAILIQLNEIENEITKYKEENTRLESDKELQSSQICILKNDLQNYKDKLSQEKSKNIETIEKLTDAINKCNLLEKNIAEYKVNNNELQSDVNQLNDHITRLKK